MTGGMRNGQRGQTYAIAGTSSAATVVAARTRIRSAARHDDILRIRENFCGKGSTLYLDICIKVSCRFLSSELSEDVGQSGAF
jgi:hypothetical protein